MRLTQMLAGLAFATCLSGVAIAQTGPVRIELKDGSLIVGTILSQTSGDYRVRTSLGELTISGASVARIVTPVSPAGPLRLHGSNTVGEKLVPRLLESHAAKQGFVNPEWIVGGSPEERTLKTTTTSAQPGMTAEVYSHGSSTAFSALKEGKADIGMSSRPIKDTEIRELRDAGLGDVSLAGEHVLALDGLAVIVNAVNRIDRLSIEQIAQIFAGEITDWGAVGGAPGPIKLYARDGKSGTFDTFSSLVLGRRTLSSKATRFESSTELSDHVADDHGGIGFISLAYVRSAKALALSTACGITSTPGLFSVKSEEYPLSRRLYLYTAEAIRLPAARDFVSYTLSDDAQSTVSASEYVDLTVQEADTAYLPARVTASMPGADGEREEPSDFIRLASTLKGATRLSLTFRFDYNAANLDSRAREDLRRLASFLRRPENARREVFLVGFADNKGSYAYNKRLGMQRAETVRERLELSERSITVMTGGKLMPVACNTDDPGMAKNRRVEVWLR